jgi:outer membrane cobalamin receptor
VDAYLVLDLKLAREVGNGQLSLFIENLLDSSYETMPAFPRPGRNYFATYSLSF